MMYHCELKDQPSQLTLSIRTHASIQQLPWLMGVSFSAIVQYLGELGEHAAGPPFVAYHNIDMDSLDVEIGIPVSKLLPDRDTIKAGQIPSGPIATCVFIGPYSKIAPAYDTLSQWIQDHEYEALGIAYELYLSDPSNTPLHELKTQIVLPLKRV